MTKEIYSYVLIGMLFVTLAVPAIGLIIQSSRELKRLREAGEAKKARTASLKRQKTFIFFSGRVQALLEWLN